MTLIEQLYESVENGQRVRSEELARQAMAEGLGPADILGRALIPAMNTVGEKFKNGEYFVPEMLVAAKAMKAAMEVLRPALAKTDYKPIGKVVLGTVRGDLHDIGKNLVKMMLESGGFEVVDLGVDVSPEKFVEAVREHKPQIVAMSALLTTTMLAMPDTLKALDKASLRGDIKVIIGGAAISESFSREIKADGYGADAHSAVELARSLVHA